MADDNRRRRVRDISECSESESNTAENSGLNLTQSESEVGTLSQSEVGALSQNEATALSQSVTAPSESDDTYDQDDISGEESEDTTDTEEADSAEHTDDDESKTEDEDSKVEVRRVASNKQSAESETDEDEDADSADLGSDEEAWKKERRHSGDGEEQKETVGEKTDIDNDRSNPAYIPRKGMFYEHDSRIGDGGGDGDKELDVAGNKKKLWLESHKWNHDRYDERSQAPKTKGDLVAEYGYDIRLGSSPPKAKPQRSRGYGRPRGSRQLGDYIKPAGHFDGEGNEDSYTQLRSTSGNLNSEQSQYLSSDGRYRSTDDVSNYSGRGNRRSTRRGYTQRTVPVNRGRGSASRDQPSRNTDDDPMKYAYSDEDSNHHGNIPPENRRKRLDNQHEFPNRSGRTDNGSERGRSSNYKNRGNSRSSEGNAAIGGVQSRAVVDANNVRTQRGESESSNQRWAHREQKPNAQSGNVGHDEETWEDEEIAVYSENMYARSVAEREQKSATSVKITNDVRVPRQPQYHATRTISNTQYKNVDADVRGRDRNSQIQNVVASMNKISLGKDSVVSGVSGGLNDSRKATSSRRDNDTSEIIPPVTRAFTRTSQSGVSSSVSSNLTENDSSNRDAAMAFRPVNRIPSNSVVLLQQLQSQASKPKRYSTQRQRGQLDTGDSADVVTEPLSEQAAPQVTAGYSLPPRLQRNKYYDEEALRQHMLQFPSRSVLASNVQPTSNVAYSMAGVPLPPKYYQSQPPEATQQQATESPSTLMHAARFLAPRHMIPTAHAQPGQYYQAQPMYNYVPMQAAYIPPPSQSHYRMTGPPSQIRPYVAPAAPSPQMMSEVSPSMEVRGGTVYFNAETQQPELRVGGIYYGPTGTQSGGASMSGHRPSSAIPIVNPQEAMTAGDGLQYYTNEYVPFEHYVASPVPYEASSVCVPDSSVEGAYA